MQHVTEIWRGHLTKLLLLLIVLIGLGLRIVALDVAVLDFDEIWHVELSTGRGVIVDELPRDQILPAQQPPTSLNGAPSIASVWSGMSATTHPPLYPTLLRIWRNLFGSSSAAMRSLSALASTLAIVFLFDAVRTLCSNRSALFAAAIFALSGPQIQYARELRGYGLLLLFACIAAATLLRIERDGASRLRLILLAVATCAMLLTHYFAAAACGAVGLYVLIRFHSMKRIQTVAALGCAVVVFALTWGPFMLEQRQTLSATGVGDFLTDTSASPLKSKLSRFASVPTRLLFEPPQMNAAFAIGGLGLLVVSLSLLRKQSELLFWILWLVITTGALLLVDLKNGTKVLSFIRYSLIAGPAVYALLSMLKLGRFGVAIPIVAIIGCALSLPGVYAIPRGDYAQLASDLDASIAPGEIVCFYPEQKASWFAGALYLGTSHYSRSFPREFVILSRPADEALITELRKRAGIWLIAGTDASHPSQIIPGAAIGGQATYSHLATMTHLRFMPQSTTRP